MFVRYFVQIDAPFPAVEERLLDDPATWIPAAAERAERSGEGLLVEIGFGRVVRVEKAVVIEFRPPIVMEAKTLLPLSWRSASADGLFPALEADLELAPLGQTRCQLAITGRYVPPLGRLGRATDRALLHRVAEATIKDFVDRVAELLRERVELVEPVA